METSISVRSLMMASKMVKGFKYSRMEICILENISKGHLKAMENTIGIVEHSTVVIFFRG